MRKSHHHHQIYRIPSSPFHPYRELVIARDDGGGHARAGGRGAADEISQSAAGESEALITYIRDTILTGVSEWVVGRNKGTDTLLDLLAPSRFQTWGSSGEVNVRWALSLSMDIQSQVSSLRPPYHIHSITLHWMNELTVWTTLLSRRVGRAVFPKTVDGEWEAARTQRSRRRSLGSLEAYDATKECGKDACIRSNEY